MNSDELYFEFESGQPVIDERFELASGRIRDMHSETLENKELETYFKSVSGFILFVLDTYDWAVAEGFNYDTLEELSDRNRKLFEDILPENYEKSYGNPSVCCSKFGEKIGQLLSALYFEMRSMIGFAFEEDRFEMTIRMELFIEIYGLFAEADKMGRLPVYGDLKKILYWFYSDYAEEERDKRFASIVDPAYSFARDIICESDLTDVRYLYRFGEYVTGTEIETARHLASLTEEEIGGLATTFTEGYRIGFAATGKDISIKKTASIIYQLGFERIVKKAMLTTQ